MKTIKVVAAVIFRGSESGTREVLATQRGYGEFKDWWEFPGGKIEEGETPQQALTREIKEELAFHLSMDCFYCTLISGQKEFSLLEHENATWLNAKTLRTVKWLPADLDILDTISALL